MGEDQAIEQSKAADKPLDDPASLEQGAGESADVHVHKPKPWHGLRELLREYLIIVMGVLTALAAEQAVEALHHRAQVREMTQKLRAESEENRHVIDYDANSLRASLASTDAILAELAKGGPVVTALQKPDMFNPADAAWTAIRDSALLPIMPKLLIDNAWKVDATNLSIVFKEREITQVADQAEAAIEVRRSRPHDPELDRTAQLRLAELRVKEALLIGSMAEFQQINQQMLRGERLDAPAALKKGQAPRRN